MVTPVTGKRRRIKERRRKDEIRRRWERAELTRERQIGKGSEERKGKSLREREEKVLPRNHAPRSPTDFYVQTKDGEGERRGNPWDASQSAALVCTVKRISPSLSLSLSSSQGGNAHAHITYLYTKRRLAFPSLVNTLRRHARAMSCLLYHRKDPENRERTKERGNSVLKRS